METIIVRMGLKPDGAHDLNVARGRLEKLFGSIKVDIQGAETQLLGEAGGGAGMARAGAVGGLLMGGAGIALGVLAAKKGLVLFEAKLKDGRTVVAQCTPLAFQEFLIATRSTVPASIAPPPPLPRAPAKPMKTSTKVMAIFLTPLLFVGMCVALLGSSGPSPAPSPPPTVQQAARPQLREDPFTVLAQKQAGLIMDAVFLDDGTAASSRRATSQLVSVARQNGITCEMLSVVAGELRSKGEPRAVAVIKRAMRGLCDSPKRAARPKAPTEAELDQLARDSLEAEMEKLPAETDSEKLRRPKRSNPVLDPWDPPTTE